MEELQTIFNEISERYKIPVEKVGEKYKEFASDIYGVIKETYPNEVDGFIEEKVNEYFVRNIKELFVPSPYVYAQALVAEDKDKPYKDRRATEFKSIVLSVSDPDDDNSFRKYQNTSIYWGNKKKGIAADPDKALSGNFVRLETSQNGNKYPVAIYENQYKVNNKGEGILDDDGQPILNPDYKKDIPTKLVRKMLVLVEQKSLGKTTEGWDLMLGKIPADLDCDPKHFPAVMSKTNFIGKVFRDPHLTVKKDGCDNAGFVQPGQVDVWGLAESFLPKQPGFMKLSDVPNLDFSKRNTWIAKVFVSSIKSFETKVSIEVNSDDLVNGIRMSTDYEPLMQYIEKVVQSGTEAYVIAETRQFKKKKDDGTEELISYNKLFGIVPSSLEDPIQAKIRAKSQR